MREFQSVKAATIAILKKPAHVLNIKLLFFFKKLVVKATFKNGKKAVKGKKLTLKFNGKKFTAKTNKYGIAKFTIKKNVIKKLKKGKKYTMKVTYLKNTIKTTVKVK